MRLELAVAVPGVAPQLWGTVKDGGLVMFVVLLMKLAGLVCRGEKVYGESGDEGEYESGVELSDGTFAGRWICDGGRGMGTVRAECCGLAHGTGAEGEDTLDFRRWSGCE